MDMAIVYLHNQMMLDATTFHLQGLCQGSLILRTTLVYNLFIY